MTDEQFEIIVSLLKDIKSNLSGIESNTLNISDIDMNTSDSVDLLKEIKKSMAD